MPKYKIREKAIEDLESIWLYTLDTWSEKQANNYYNLIIQEIELIAGNKSIGVSIQNIRNGYYFSRVKSHVIFYVITDKLEVVRILNQKMDIDNKLKE
ncbi:MAG: type II toxin-antitoxin system RelE/ParE family toxin [Flavobacteriales bacterium]|jgi:toxin ParE1/3/4|nr:type II toxin-antitoxin system RelE/ParE family toxin [Flavobacteriales bacterium]